MKTDEEIKKEVEAEVRPTKASTEALLRSMRRNPEVILESNRRAAGGGHDETP